jgi:hypothetical protein
MFVLVESPEQPRRVLFIKEELWKFVYVKKIERQYMNVCSIDPPYPK